MNFDKDPISSVSASELTDAKKEPLSEMTDDERIDTVARNIIRLYRPAFEELAK